MSDEPIPDEDLTEYTSQSSYSQYTKILLIDKNVEQYQKFVNGANSSTFTIVYKHTSKHQYLEDFLVANLKHVTRLAIVSHGLPGGEHHYYHNMSFMESEHFFKMSDLASGITEYSPNVAFLKTLLTKMSINRMDFLACNLLQYTEWTQYLDLLKSFKSGLVVGASNDQTGNLQYGGNWTMENTLENIKTVYFSSAIENYTGLLALSYVTIDDNGTSRTWGYDMGGYRIWNCSDHTGIVNVPYLTYNPSMPTYHLLETFQNSTTLSNVIVADGIKQYDRSFKGCNTLTSAQIGAYAIYLPETFMETSITSIHIGAPNNTLTTTGPSCCYNCTLLTSVTLGTNVTQMDGGSFGNCTLLTEITIPTSVTQLAGLDGSGLTSLTIVEPSNIKLFAGLSSTPLTSITIPSSVTEVHPISNMAITSLTLPSSVKTFYGCQQCSSLTSVTIPSGVTALNYGFRECSSLTSLTIPDSCTLANPVVGYVSDFMFRDLNSLTSITLPSSLTSSFPPRLFRSGLGITTVTIPYGVTQLADSTIVSETITEIVVPDTCTAASYSFIHIEAYAKINSFRVYNSNNIYYDYTGSLPMGTSLHGPPGSNGYNAIMATFDTTDTANWNLIGEKIALPDPSGNVLEITTLTSQDLTDETVTGTTTVSKRSFTKNLIKGLFSFNGSALTGKAVTLKNITLPGFPPAEEIVVFNSSTNESSNFTNTLNTANIAGKNFYVLMENQDDEITIPSVASSVTVKKTGETTFSINNGITITTVNSGESYTFDGLTVNLGSVFGYLVDPSTICFREGTKIECLDESSSEAVNIAVEELKVGMLVKTYKHGYIPITMIGKKSLYNPGNDTRIKDRLYECTPENYPELTENLYITGCHSILVDQLTEQQTMDTLRESGDIFITDDKYRLMSHLDVRSVPYTCEGNYTIYHVTLEHPDEYMNYGIWANGLLVESCSRKSMEEKGYMKDILRG